MTFQLSIIGTDVVAHIPRTESRQKAEVAQNSPRTEESTYIYIYICTLMSAFYSTSVDEFEQNSLRHERWLV